TPATTASCRQTCGVSSVASLGVRAFSAGQNRSRSILPQTLALPGAVGCRGNSWRAKHHVASAGSGARSRQSNLAALDATASAYTDTADTHSRTATRQQSAGPACRAGHIRAKSYAGQTAVTTSAAGQRFAAAGPGAPVSGDHAIRQPRGAS